MKSDTFDARPLDTTREAHAVQAAVYRRMTPRERMEMAIRMSEEARQIALDGITRRNPGWTRARCRRALFESLLGPELCRLAWGELETQGR